MTMGIRNMDDEQARALGAEHALERERRDHERTRQALRKAIDRVDVLERKLARRGA